MIENELKTMESAQIRKPVVIREKEKLIITLNWSRMVEKFDRLIMIWKWRLVTVMAVRWQCTVRLPKWITDRYLFDAET